MYINIRMYELACPSVHVQVEGSLASALARSGQLQQQQQAASAGTTIDTSSSSASSASSSMAAQVSALCGLLLAVGRYGTVQTLYVNTRLQQVGLRTGEWTVYLVCDWYVWYVICG